MTDDRSLDNMSLKELGALAVSLDLAHWSRLRKAELIDAIRGKLKSQKKAANSQRRGKGSASKKSASSSRQATLFDVEEDAAVSERSRKKTKRGGSGASAAQKSAVESPAPKKSKEAKSKEAKNAKSSKQEEPSAAKKTRRAGKKAESVPAKEPVAAAPKRSRGKKAEIAAAEEKSEEPRKKRGRKSAPAAPEPEPAPTASKRRKSAVGNVEETAEKQPAKRRGRQAKAETEEAPKRAVKEKPIESAKKGKKSRKAEPVESAPAKSAPVQESVSAEEPVKKRRTRRSAEKKAEKQVELEAEVEAAALAEAESEERSAEEKKPRKSRKSKSAKAERPSPSDDELWNWDDDEEDEGADSDGNSDDEFDDFDFDDEPSAAASASSDSEPEPEPEPEPAAPPPSQEAIALKEKMRRQKFIGTDHDRVDRLLLMVCDSYWLRACWEITPLLIDRVRSAMGRHWHTAEPVLRVFLVDAETKSAATHREHVADLEIRGGIDNWYVPVDNPPSSFMVELGYRSRDGQFFTLISSNVVKTPQRFVHDAFGRLNVGSEPSSSALERGDAHTEQREPFDVKTASSRPEFDPSAAPFGRPSPFNRVPSSSFWSDGSDVKFTVDAEIVIKGRVAPGSSVSVKDEHIRLRPDGTFSVRYSLPERRHVFPVVATSSDGIETQTIVLAVDRNTKTLDPVFKEDEED